jgi:hypothetical protein
MSGALVNSVDVVGIWLKEGMRLINSLERYANI